MLDWYIGLTSDGRRTFWACFGGYALDAMDVQIYPFIVPVLIGLSRRHQDAFAAATGGIGELLAAEPEALAAWATQVITGRSPVADRRTY